LRVPLDEKDSLTLRVGRQELSLGTQRLVSVREGPNVRQSFDGARLWGNHSGWDWNFEFAYQFGTFGDGDISAWTAASDTGYTFAHAPWTPRLGLRADVTSGDRNPNDKDLQTFNPLFPKGAYFSETALIGPQNHIDVHPGIELHPTRTVTLNADVDFFWRESTH